MCHSHIKIIWLHIAVFHEHDIFHFGDYDIMILSNKNTSKLLWIVLFLYLGFLLQTLIFTGQQRLGEDHLYSYLPLSTFQYYSDVYLQLGKWDDYVVILIPLHIIIKFLLDEIYSPSWISIWLNVTSSLTNNSMLDLVTVICCCQVVDFNWHRLTP